jgi:hypothetical protein
VDQLIDLDVDGGMTTALGALQVAGALAGGLFAGQALGMRVDWATRSASGHGAAPWRASGTGPAPS